MILPGVALAVVLVFLLTLGEFGVPMYLRYEVFPVEVFTQFSAFYNFETATAATMPLVLVPLVLLVFETFFFREKTYQLTKVEFGMKARRLSVKEREARIHELLALMQLEPAASSKPSELSGGQQQRVALARALDLHPKILLTDEPLSGLHYELAVELRGEILHLPEVTGFILLYVTHDRDEAFAFGSRVAVMNQGRIEALGAPADVRRIWERLGPAIPEGEAIP